MKKLLIVLLSMALTTPSFATLIVRTNPSLTEIQAGIDACNRGDEDNCKYEHYPGVVRKTASGGRILPAGGDYILGKRLTPGSVLPKLSDRRALLRKLKSKEVEVHSFLTHESPILLASSDAGEFLQDHFQRHAVIVPAHIAELARQNGVAPHEMLLHIQTRWEGNPQDAQDIINEHTQLIIAIGANLVTVDQEDIDNKLEEIETLIEVIGDTENSYKADLLQSVLDNLQIELENLTTETLLNALSSEIVRRELQVLVEEDITEIEAYIRKEGPEPVDNVLWEQAKDAAEEALDNISPDITIEQLIDRTDVNISTFTRELFNPETDQFQYVRNWIEVNLPDVELADNLLHVFDDGYEEHLAIVRLVVTLAGDLGNGFEDSILKTVYNEGYHDGYRDGYADGFRDGVNSVRETLGG